MKKTQVKVSLEDRRKAGTVEKLTAVYMAETDAVIAQSKIDGVGAVQLYFLDGIYRQFQRDMAVLERDPEKFGLDTTSTEVLRSYVSIVALMTSQLLDLASDGVTHYAYNVVDVKREFVGALNLYASEFMAEAEQCDCPACTARRAGHASSATH